MRKLREGDIIALEEGHKVYADVPRHFVYSNKKGDFSRTHEDVKIGGDFSYLAGRYVVYKTASEGGGTGHGPHDIFPDGHHVYCERIGKPPTRVDFYQSGCFTAMIEDIKPIGTAVQHWAEVEK